MCTSPILFVKCFLKSGFSGGALINMTVLVHLTRRMHEGLEFGATGAVEGLRRSVA